jgi:hypothetical protein
MRRLFPGLPVREDALRDFAVRYRENRLLDNASLLVLRLREAEEKAWEQAGF